MIGIRSFKNVCISSDKNNAPFNKKIKNENGGLRSVPTEMFPSIFSGEKECSEEEDAFVIGGEMEVNPRGSNQRGRREKEERRGGRNGD